MDPKQLEEAKSILQKLKQSEGSNGIMKRATMLAVVLGFVQSTAVLGANADVNKLVNALEKSDAMSPLSSAWRPNPGGGGHGQWNDWKNWKDWSDWKDWKNWNDWKDWKNWNDWKDWKNWNDWKDWRDWKNFNH